MSVDILNYTTTNVHQAEQWGNRRFHIGKSRGAKSAAVVEFTIDRDVLAGLEHMAFSREDFAPNSDYWQLVAHCRGGRVEVAAGIDWALGLGSPACLPRQCAAGSGGSLEAGAGGTGGEEESGSRSVGTD